MKAKYVMPAILIGLAMSTTGYAQNTINRNDARVIKNTESSEITQAALFHYHGHSEQDWRIAFDKANKALEINSKDAVAHRLLGNLYYHGRGVKQDFDNALYHYEEAATADAVASYMVGKMYLNGEGADLDIYEGAKYMKQAADMGESIAQAELAKLSLDQSKIETNQEMKVHLEKSAYHYATLCTKAKMPDCIEVLAEIVNKGLAGVKASPESAKLIYKMIDDLK